MKNCTTKFKTTHVSFLTTNNVQSTAANKLSYVHCLALVLPNDVHQFCRVLIHYWHKRVENLEMKCRRQKAAMSLPLSTGAVGRCKKF